jgi:hypothetical protein
MRVSDTVMMWGMGIGLVVDVVLVMRAFVSLHRDSRSVTSHRG